MKRITLIPIIIFISLLPGCGSSLSNVDSCGDGVIDVGEECDSQEFGGMTCQSRGYYSGTLACTDQCTLDISGCDGSCGDGTIQAGEQCDGDALGGAACTDEDRGGYNGGQLKCSADCLFDTSSCEATGYCGDGTWQSEYEECEGNELGGHTCADFLFLGGTLRCSTGCAFDTSFCTDPTTCGNGTVDSIEACEGDDLRGETCETLGYYGGTLACTDSCGFDLTGCASAGICGDDTVQGDHETCDGNDVNGLTCQDFGYYGGTLGCALDCGAYDLSDCQIAGQCGDGIINDTYGETCDGTNYGTTTCGSLGFYGGEVTCDASCHLVLTECASAGWCGNSTVEDGSGETCDGTNLNGESCGSLGYYGGALSCQSSTDANPCRFNLTSCEGYGICGDGNLDDIFGEQCDGVHFADADCTDLGYHGGLLLCDADTCRYNLVNCEIYGKCGDGTLNTPDEICDTDQLGGESCTSLGYYGGELACTSACAYDLSDCIANGKCGDGDQDSPYEECDLGDISVTCQDLGFYYGTVTCDTDCTVNADGCSGRCGDDILDLSHYEECDTNQLNDALCSDHGYYGTGAPACVDCVLDYSACDQGQCGDNTIQDSYNEVCDLSEFGDETCESQGFPRGGTLICDADCLGIDTSNCDQSFCGDGTVDLDFEQCDMLGTVPCQTLPGMPVGTTGQAQCIPPEQPNACQFDVASCVAP